MMALSSLRSLLFLFLTSLFRLSTQAAGRVGGAKMVLRRRLILAGLGSGLGRRERERRGTREEEVRSPIDVRD